MAKRLMMYLTLMIGLGCIQEVHSAGFYLIEQSVSSMGTAYAGAAATAEDASTIYFNPAGMTKLCGKGELDFQSVMGGHLVFPSNKFRDDGSTYNPCPQVNDPTLLLGTNGHDAGEPALVGNAYFVQNYRCQGLATGLGINAPFGLVTDYGNKWKGRYYAIRSALLSININPAIAYKINDCWSIGAGVSAMYLHIKLTNAVDFGGILSCNGLEGTPQEEDGKVIVKGNSWGYGGNVGVLYEPRCGTRLGLSYRSEVKHHISGKERFQGVPETIGPLAPLFQNTGAKSKVTFPSMVEFSGYHELDSCWALLCDITWFKWDVLQKVVFKFKNEFQADEQITLKWKNSLRYALGTTYRPNNCLVYRLGVAYDESPARGKELTTPRIPDTDRVWLTCGAGYDCGAFHFDVAYAHVFTATNAKINKIASSLIPGGEDQFRGGLKGSWRAHVDILSGQLVVTF